MPISVNIKEHELLDKLSNRLPFEERENENIELSDISAALVLDYLQNVKSRLVDNFSNTPFSEILNLMDLYTGSKERRMLKNVAAMMFSKNPAKFFPTTQVDIVIFPDGCIENPNNMIEEPNIEDGAKIIPIGWFERLVTLL